MASISTPRIARAIYHRTGLAAAADLLLLPYGRLRHQRLLAGVERNPGHLFTCCRRSPDQLAALTGPVLDFLAPRRRGPLRILNFACSNGAEAYTIASTLLAHAPSLDFEILASDLHQEMVEKGRSGRYTVEELGGPEAIPGDFLARTFKECPGAGRIGEASSGEASSGEASSREASSGEASSGETHTSQARATTLAVRPEVRARLSFRRANLLDRCDVAACGCADIVFAQNVFIHMNRDQARAAFTHLLETLRPRAALFLDGMELDLRAELTELAGLRPLDFRVRAIYESSRRFSPHPWWAHYWGREPYSPFAPDPARRYATIFLRDDTSDGSRSPFYSGR